MTISERHYLIYADGSCLGNPGPGGWGVVIRDPDGAISEINGSDPATTNNRMELMGAIEGLRATEPGSQVVLRSDSQYVVNTMNRGWKRNANQDLWKLLDAETRARMVRFEWVRGHGADAVNNRADELAVMGANGKPAAAGAPAPEKKPRAAKSSKKARAGEDQDAAPLLSSLLRDGESIGECAGCGRMFVRSRDEQRFCSQARCQLKARR